jgi:hypothetical protein
MRRQLEDSEFLWICSDVIYPAGGIDDYLVKFCRPFREIRGRIYAVPGNHDWYDDLTGFMYWFCGRADAPPWPRPPLFSTEFLRGLIWRRAPKVDMAKLDEALSTRPRPADQDVPQPGPYFALDAGPVLLVGIDVGIEGRIDRDQGAWLRRVSESEKPKILLSGKPLYVNGTVQSLPIEPNPDGSGGGTVAEIVTDPKHNYLAVLGGDTHNYQRYPVPIGDGRTLMCVVSGGGGAFLHDTHTIPHLDAVEGMPVAERDFRCYPLRGDSLARFGSLYARKLLGPLHRLLGLDPDVAAKLMAERLEAETGAAVRPVRESARSARPLVRDRLAARLAFAIHHRAGDASHVPFAEWLDSNEPPLFKNFLRLDAGADELRIRCFAVTGCAGDEEDPAIEDELVARRVGDAWEWSFPPGT